MTDYGFLLIIFAVVAALFFWWGGSCIKNRLDHIQFGRDEIRSIASIDRQMAAKYGSE
jgi:hypothetical protein